MFWKKQNWEADDPHLTAVKGMPFRRKFPFGLPREPGLYVIRGPRQIGKSSWLKSMLLEAAQLDAARTEFLSCENLGSSAALSEYLRSTRHARWTFLDEVSFVPGWDRAIKHEVDSTKDRVLVLTGSQTADLRRGADRMPGRWRAGGEFLLLPMGFEEHLEMANQAGWPKLERVAALERYFVVGGFPTAMLEGGPEGAFPRKAAQTALSWLIGDAVKLGKQELYLKEVLGQVARTLATPISLQSLAQSTQLGSHHTAQDYIALLEDCFALRSLYAMDPDQGTLRFRKQKKFYFTDPVFYWASLLAVRAKPNSTDRLMPALAEQAAHEALARVHQRMGYLSTRQGEVDFINQRDWAIEVKWATAAHNLSKAYLEHRCVSKQVWTQHTFFEAFPQVNEPI
jgi:predicted AAA+ superfamily ATPase